MTEQEAFTIVKDHLLTQNKQAIEGEACLYRGPNGTKCAIGALITDEEYNELVQHDLHLHSVIALFKNFELESLKGLSEVFLVRLQRIHDVFKPHEWEDQLRLTANQYKLNWE